MGKIPSNQAHFSVAHTKPLISGCGLLFVLLCPHLTDERDL